MRILLGSGHAAGPQHFAVEPDILALGRIRAVGSHAFWPTIFAIDSQQPIRVLDPYRESMGGGSAPPDYHFLDARQLPTEEKQRFPFIANWTTTSTICWC